MPSAWPRLQSKLISQWILVTLAASLIAAIDGGFIARHAALIPSRVVHGEVWRLVTWPFVEVGPLSLIITCVSIYKFGGELAYRWGDRRLQRFMFEVLLGAAVVTCVLALATGTRYMVRLGGWAACDTLVIAWARQFPGATLRLYGLITLSGRQLINFTLASAAVIAVYYGPVRMAPELVACAAAALYPRDRLSR